MDSDAYDCVFCNCYWFTDTDCFGRIRPEAPK